MRKRNIVLTVLLALILVGALSLAWPAKVRVIGSMSDRDIKEIQELVWQDIRGSEFPSLDRGSLHHVRYVLAGLRRYARLRVLWIEVKDPRYARVVVGLNTNSVASDGWDFMVRKNANGEKWEVTGSAYWGDPGVAPSDFRIIP